MSHMTDHTEWFNRTTNKASGRTAATAAGIPIATLNRQLGRNEISAENVIAIARAYGARPVAALVQTGYLEPSEAGGVTIAEVAELLSDQDMIRIMAYRINQDEAAWEGTFGEVIESATPESEPQWHDLYAVADSSPDHEEEDSDFD